MVDRILRERLKKGYVRMTASNDSNTILAIRLLLDEILEMR